MLYGKFYQWRSGKHMGYAGGLRSVGNNSDSKGSSYMGLDNVVPYPDPPEAERRKQSILSVMTSKSPPPKPTKPALEDPGGGDLEPEVSTRRFSINEEDLTDPDILAKKLYKLAEIVIRKHFYASYSEYDDLMGEAVLKALRMIDEGKWDKTRGTLLNYLYTGMRNEMHNYLYHCDKLKNTKDWDSCEDEGRDDSYFNEDGLYIDRGLIQDVCEGLPGFGSGLEVYVERYLRSIGFRLEGRDVRKGQNPTSSAPLSYLGLNIDLELYDQETKADIISRIGGLVIWKSLSTASYL